MLGISEMKYRDDERSRRERRIRSLVAEFRRATEYYAADEVAEAVRQTLAAIAAATEHHAETP